MIPNYSLFPSGDVHFGSPEEIRTPVGGFRIHEEEGGIKLYVNDFPYSILRRNDLGHVLVEVRLTNPLAQETVTVPDAVVDTGATFTTVPQRIGEKLKLQPFRKRKVRTASGEEELTESIVLIEIQNEGTVNPVLISPKIDRVLVGVLTLEALGLKVEPKAGRLEKTELLLLQFF